MFGAVGHNDLWIEHLSLGETKLIYAALGLILDVNKTEAEF